MKPQQTPEQTFYRWVDARGRLHVVSSLDDVPAAERPRVAAVQVNGVDSVPGVRAVSSAPPWQPDWLSFAAGVGVALALSLLYRALPGTWRWVLRASVALGCAALLVGAYLGWMRRTAGTGTGETLASPSALIQDARDAVEKMNTRERQQSEEIRKIQAEGR